MVAVLFAFLRDVRAALLVAAVIPLSMLVGFTGMKYFGVSANLMSLGAIRPHRGRRGGDDGELRSALVAALGFVPMALSTGAGSEVQRPLATVVIGGVVTSTLLTLVVLPTIYEVVEGWVERRGAGGRAPAVVG